MAITVPEYVAPEQLADIDEEVIHARMLATIPKDIDKTEGGFAFDFTKPAAIEKAEAMEVLNDVVQLFFPAWSTGEFLDMLGEMVGLKRKQATASTAVLEITGTPGTVIPAGFLFSTAATIIAENIEFAALQTTTIDAEGNATVTVECTQTGLVGNVPSDCIILMVQPIEGITAVTNPLPATGGFEVESDDEYRLRVIDREQNGEDSFVGCDADYRRWALECDGVGSVIVIPEWEGRGTGTVKVILMDSNGQGVSQTTIENVYEHIIHPEDRTQRLAPIGAILTVTTATALNISITAKVLLTEGATIEDVTESFQANLLPFYKEAMDEGILRLTRVGCCLSETPGVEDYEELTINGGTSNIPVSVEAFPSTQSVVLTDLEAQEDAEEEEQP